MRHAVRRGKALGFNGLMGNWGIAGAALVAGTLTDLIGRRARTRQTRRQEDKAVLH